jgi:hypothetical protein
MNKKLAIWIISISVFVSLFIIFCVSSSVNKKKRYREEQRQAKIQRIEDEERAKEQKIENEIQSKIQAIRNKRKKIEKAKTKKRAKELEEINAIKKELEEIVATHKRKEEQREIFWKLQQEFILNGYTINGTIIQHMGNGLLLVEASIKAGGKYVDKWGNITWKHIDKKEVKTRGEIVLHLPLDHYLLQKADETYFNNLRVIRIGLYQFRTVLGSARTLDMYIHKYEYN